MLHYFWIIAECKRLEEKDQDFKRVSIQYDLMLKEKERLDTKLNGQCCLDLCSFLLFDLIIINCGFSIGKKELQENKKRLTNEIAALKQENQTLNDSLRQMEKEKSLKQSEIHTLNEKFSALQNEKDKVVYTLKGNFHENHTNRILSTFIQINNSQMSANDLVKKIWTSSGFLRIMKCY